MQVPDMQQEWEESLASLAVSFSPPARKGLRLLPDF